MKRRMTPDVGYASFTNLSGILWATRCKQATYVGFMPTDAIIEKLLSDEVKRAGVLAEAPKVSFPVIVKNGTLQNGKSVQYIFNYSAQPNSYTYTRPNGTELLSGKPVTSGARVELGAWDFKIIEAPK